MADTDSDDAQHPTDEAATDEGQPKEEPNKRTSTLEELAARAGGQDEPASDSSKEPRKPKSRESVITLDDHEREVERRVQEAKRKWEERAARHSDPEGSDPSTETEAHAGHYEKLMQRLEAAERKIAQQESSSRSVGALQQYLATKATEGKPISAETQREFSKWYEAEGSSLFAREAWHSQKGIDRMFRASGVLEQAAAARQRAAEEVHAPGVPYEKLGLERPSEDPLDNIKLSKKAQQDRADKKRVADAINKLTGGRDDMPIMPPGTTIS